MADLPSGASGLLVRGYTGKEADRLVTRIDPGVVSLVAELGGHERQTAEEVERWKTHIKERYALELLYQDGKCLPLEEGMTTPS
jgi:hypothetical protein